MCTQIVLIGGGGHAKSVIDTLNRLKKYNQIVITDPLLRAGSTISGCEVVGSDETLQTLYANGIRHAFLAVGDVGKDRIRQLIYERVKDYGFLFPSLIDPSAIVSTSVTTESGVFIGKGAVVNAESKIGQMSIVNTRAVLEHDCIVGGFCHIATGAVICGGCTIEDGAFIGANATIIQGVKIGRDVVVGAGAVVNRDVPAGYRAVGVPVRMNKMPFKPVRME